MPSNKRSLNFVEQSFIIRHLFIVVFFFPIYTIYNLHFLKQKAYSYQVLIYLNVPGIPLRKPLQNKQIVEEQWMCEF